MAGRAFPGRRRRGNGNGAVDGAEPPGGPEDAPGDPEQLARTICLRLLTAAPRTRSQLAEALVRRGVPDDVIDRVLDRYTEVGLIDDETFARMWVSSRHTGRGLARRALGHELRQRGVDNDVVAEAVSALDPDTERETARALVRRRLRGLDRQPPDVAVRRLVGMLARKGYPSGLAYAVVREELAARDAEISADLDEAMDSAAYDDLAD